jgi:hypothetical protein
MMRGRVEDGRGGDAEVAPSPVPAHQTGRADFPHPAFRQASSPGPRRHKRPPSPCNTAPSEVFGSSRCCQAHRQSPFLDLFKSTPEARALPSTGITRLPQYYDPLRLPPPRSAAPAAHSPVGLPRCPHHLSDVPCPLPRRIERVLMSISFPIRNAFPGLGGSASATALSRPAQALLALRPIGSLDRLYAAFVTRLRRRQLPDNAARQLPVSSTILRVEPSSTGDTRPRGAPRRPRSES